MASRFTWSIGIYVGESPFGLGPPTGLAGFANPVIRAEMVTDIPARSVADPFLIWRDGTWTLFFEVWNAKTDRGEIACATSVDGLHWSYGSVVLREPFHLSYPHVFEWQGDVYMIPESRAADSIRLYRADVFPHSWSFVRVLRRGPYADPTLLRHEDMWWMFAQRGLDELRLFSCETLDGSWVEHPKSPLWPGNRRYSRPGGRMLRFGGKLFRFAQDGWPSYGNNLRALEIDVLSASSYEEHEIAASPILRASRKGWNAVGMHHLDAQPFASLGWLAAVDGATIGDF